MKKKDSTIKITSCNGTGLSLGDHELDLGFSRLTDKLRSVISEMEDSGGAIDDLFSYQPGDMDDRETIIIYHHQKQGEPDKPYGGDKVEITVRSKNEFDATSDVLKLAAKYIGENKHLYEFMGDIKVSSDYENGQGLAKATLYIFKKSDEQ